MAKKQLRDNPAEIVSTFKDLYSAESELNTRYDDDYSDWRLDPFQVSKKEGAYDSYTTNGPAVLANKCIDAIVQSKLQVKIMISDEDHEQRKNLTMTEQACIGHFNLIDDVLIKRMEPTIISQLTWYSVLRGKFYLYYLLTKKNKETKPVLRIWDPLNCKVVVGGEGVKYAIHKRIDTAESIKADYGLSDTKITEAMIDKQKQLVEVYVYVDDEWEKVVIGGEFAGKSTEHGLGYCPVVGLQVGSTPYIQSETYKNAYKDQGESVFQNSREIYDMKSKLLSYHITIAGLMAHTPLKLTYDSAKGGELPKVEGNPWMKDSGIPLDIGKGQDIQEMMKMQLPSGFMDALSAISREESIGGLSPVTYGFSDSAMPVGTTNMLIHGAREFLNPRIQNVERGLEWICEEFVTQYKKGGFPALKLYGAANTGKYFQIKVKPQDILNEWKIQCILTPDMPQDVLVDTQIAQTWVQSGLTDKRTARERLPIQDPDKVQDNIDLEQAHDIPVLKFREMITQLHQDGQDELANTLLNWVERQEAMQNAQQGQPNQQGQSGNQLPTRTPPALTSGQGSTNYAMNNGSQREIPGDIKSAFKQLNVEQRLRQMGMVKGQ